jgi:hypothetical protein
VETPRLSKSRVQSGAQCTLQLWYATHARELATPPGEAQHYLFDRGREIGELARARYPGGQLIAADHRQSELALRQTAEQLAQDSAATLYEPAFLHRNVLARVDILRAAGEEGFDLIEVKAATRAKKVYLQDVAIQYWILSGTRTPIRRAGLLLLDRSYAFDGHSVDPDQLFRFKDLTAEVRGMQDKIEALVEELQEIVGRREPPSIEPGLQCREPYDCPFIAHCTADLVPAEHPVRELPRLHRNKLLELREMGIEEVAEVPDDFPLAPAQSRVRDCVREQRDWIGSGLGKALGSVHHPVHHLDFEAFMPAIPLYAGNHPFDALPFQYSIHRESENGQVEHLEHLCRDGTDPRHSLAEQLLEDLAGEGSICVYTSYEERMIASLADAFPDLRDALRSLPGRIWDLHPIIREHYYHVGFRGSFSIKAVLPVLVPDLSYQGLEIADGLAAAREYEIAVKTPDDEARQRTFANLLEYCRLDTLAMLRLRGALAAKAEER